MTSGNRPGGLVRCRGLGDGVELLGGNGNGQGARAAVRDDAVNGGALLSGSVARQAADGLQGRLQRCGVDRDQLSRRHRPQSRSLRRPGGHGNVKLVALNPGIGIGVTELVPQGIVEQQQSAGWCRGRSCLAGFAGLGLCVGGAQDPLVWHIRSCPRAPLMVAARTTVAISLLFMVPALCWLPWDVPAGSHSFERDPLLCYSWCLTAYC